MPKVKFLKPFKYSPDGIKVIEYSASREEQDVDDQCAQIACHHGYAEAAGKPAKSGKPGNRTVQAPEAGDGEPSAADSPADAGDARPEAA